MGSLRTIKSQIIMFTTLWLKEPTASLAETVNHLSKHVIVL